MMQYPQHPPSLNPALSLIKTKSGRMLLFRKSFFVFAVQNRPKSPDPPPPAASPQHNQARTIVY